MRGQRDGLLCDVVKVFPVSKKRAEGRSSRLDMARWPGLGKQEGTVELVR